MLVLIAVSAIGLHLLERLPMQMIIALITPTASAMRKQLKTCDNYAHEYSIMLNAAKFKVD